MGNKSSRLIFLEANQKLNEYMFEEILNENDGIRRGPFGGALKKDIFVKESDYVVYEQRNAIYDRFDFRYKISFKKYEEMKSFLVKEGDFLLSGAGTIGKISRVPRNASKGIINQALIRIRIDSEKVNPDYFLHWMRSEKMQHRLTSGNPGSAITNLVPLSEVKKWLISIPSIDEQRKIGVFFNLFDNLIALHQQELEVLKQTKQGFLQKMFPKDGDNVPEIRFIDFKSEWKDTTLNKITKIIGGGTPDTKEPTFWDGEIDWYSPTEIGKAIYANGSVRKITQLGLEKSSAKILPANKTILFTSRAGIGDTAILKKNGTTNQGFQSLVVEDNCDVYFLYSMSERIKKYALKNAAGSTFLEISGKNLGKMPILTPSFEEQSKIGEFFRQLDEVIGLKEQELEALKQTKQGFLQKVFI